VGDGRCGVGRGFARKRMEEEAGTYRPMVDGDGADEEGDDDDWGEDEDWLEGDEIAVTAAEESEEETIGHPDSGAGGSGTGAGPTGGSSGKGYLRRRGI
jgi:hypothetical protein